MKNLIFRIGFSFTFGFSDVGCFFVWKFCFMWYKGGYFGKVELCGGTIGIGVTLDGLYGGIGVFVGETV